MAALSLCLRPTHVVNQSKQAEQQSSVVQDVMTGQPKDHKMTNLCQYQCSSGHLHRNSNEV